MLLVWLTAALAGELHQVAPADLVIAQKGFLEWTPADPPKAQSCSVAVAFDAEGAVYDVLVDPPCDPSFQQALASTVEGWRFEPVLVEGAAVAATSRFQVFYDPSHEPADFESGAYGERGFQVHHAHVVVAYRLDPRYPGKYASDEPVRCVFEVHVNQKGWVDEVHPEEGCPEAFAKSGRNALRSWRWEHPTIDGRPTKVELNIGVNFMKR